MTVQEVINHLVTLPPNLPVMELWDERGAYYNKTRLPRVMDVVRSSSPLSGGKGWVGDEGYRVFERKKVVVI